MKRLLSLVLATSLVATPALALDASAPTAPSKLGVFERTQLRLQVAWWKAILFEMRKNDQLLRQFGTGNGPSAKNVVVGAVNTSLLPLAYTTLRFRKARRAKKVLEARAILADLEHGVTGVEANRRLLENGLRESEAFKNAAAGRMVFSEERSARLAQKFRHVRWIAVAGLVAAFVFDAGAMWIQIAMEPGTLDQKRGDLEQAIDQAELRLMQE